MDENLTCDEKSNKFATILKEIHKFWGLKSDISFLHMTSDCCPCLSDFFSVKQLESDKEGEVNQMSFYSCPVAVGGGENVRVIMYSAR